jgi:hypothetical protein
MVTIQRIRANIFGLGSARNQRDLAISPQTADSARDAIGGDGSGPVVVRPT